MESWSSSVMAMAATAANVSVLNIFIGLVFLRFVCFLLTTAKGRVEDGIPIPSCRHSVVWKGNRENGSDLSTFCEKFLKDSPAGSRYLSEADDIWQT
jgi:hypothetical protein